MSSKVGYYEQNSECKLITAIYRNDFAEVRNLIKNGSSDVNANDSDGYTSVHAAVKSENLEILDFLLQQPEVDVNARSFLSETPLLLSCKASSSAFALKLLAHEVDVTVQNLYMQTALHLSACQFHDVSLEIIKRGADVNAQDFTKRTPLHEAATKSDFEMVSMLVYYGANADVVDCNGLSPFTAALSVGANVEIQELLMELEVDYNRIYNDVSTLLMAFSSKSPLCSELIERGADVNYIHPTCNAVKFALNDDEVFRKVWDKFDVEKAYTFTDKSPLVLVIKSIFKHDDDLIEHDLSVKQMESILLTEKGVKMLLSLKDFEICESIGYFFSSALCLEISSSQLYKFLCIWLSCGINYVHIMLVVKIYEMYGYVDVFELLIHMDVFLNNMVDFLTLPHLICDVSGNVCIDDVFKQCAERGELVEYEKMLEFGTPSDTARRLYYDIRDSFYSLYPELYKDVEEKLKMLPAVPSLLELSRNSAKKTIIKKYNIKKCSLFYSILKWMPLPLQVKQILSFKLPVNKFSNQ